MCPPMPPIASLLLRAVVALLAIAAAQAPLRADMLPECGLETPCRITGGQYRVRFPADWDGKRPLGAILYIHGYQGSADAEMQNMAWQKLADRLHVAFVIPDGEGGSWSYPGAPRQRRDEFTYFENLVNDLTARFPIRRDRLMVSGFSIGGSMVWNLACYRATLFAGFAPIAGAFWNPIPEHCPAVPPFLFHVHGTADTTVPLAGRPIGERWHQGDVAKSLSVWQREAGLPTVFPAAAPAQGLGCQRQQTDQVFFEVCLHSGGHSVRAEWIARAWRELSERRGWD